MEAEYDLRNEIALVFYNGSCRFRGKHSDCLKVIEKLQQTEPLNPATKMKMDYVKKRFNR